MYINLLLRVVASKIVVWGIIAVLSAYYLYNVIFFMTHTTWRQHTDPSDELAYYPVDESNLVLLPEEKPTTSTEGENTTKKTCDIETRTKCDLSEAQSCATICDGATSCVRFTDNTVSIIMRDGQIVRHSVDKNPNIGICITINTDVEAKSCTSRYGAKRELHEIARSQYGYVCECTAPTVFTKSHVSGDCDVFVGCKNRGNNVAAHDWTHPEGVKCKCLWNEVFRPYVKNSHGPLCERGNYYEVTQPVSLPSDEYYLPWSDINPEYVQYFGGDSASRLLHPKGLPNPCLFDAVTYEAIDTRLVGSKRIRDTVVCYSRSHDFVTISFEDDYLYNNGGRRANGIVRVSNGFYLPIGPTSWDIYETGTLDSRASILAPPLKGRAYSLRSISRSIYQFLDKLIGSNSYPFATTRKIEYVIFFNYPEDDIVFKSPKGYSISYQVLRNLFIRSSLMEEHYISYQNMRVGETEYDFYEDVLTADASLPFISDSSRVYKPYEREDYMIEYEPILVTDSNDKLVLNTKCPFYTGQVIITSKGALAPLFHEHTGLISDYVENANSRYPTIPKQIRDPKQLRHARLIEREKFYIWRMGKEQKFKFNEQGPYHLHEETQESRQTCIAYESFLPKFLKGHVKCSPSEVIENLETLTDSVAQLLWASELSEADALKMGAFMGAIWL